MKTERVQDLLFIYDSKGNNQVEYMTYRVQRLGKSACERVTPRNAEHGRTEKPSGSVELSVDGLAAGGWDLVHRESMGRHRDIVQGFRPAGDRGLQ